MADLEALEDWAAPLLQRIEPAGRAKLARTLAQELRRSQQQRILAQRAPDGTPFTPRKPHKLREKQGRVKRKAKMFQKLRTASYLKAKGDAKGVTVGFTGRIARIARVHQYGLRDRIAPRGPMGQYEKRELLGFTSEDQERLKDAILAHLDL
ncbi:phage virion morphogenesis protein [Pseudomonas sp. S07E 245]|uniref:phage virion morphogenesis protein n=1 Tax=Pseudomonas sp. S07E 245 TaxID=2866278 RepID=UPI001C73D1C5|nr:phage virion morphogenesis protein [Pseudomonas sp. S07E 245]QYX51507.1 phage virion morphogenesis protein [Pseudomonas sp. S07E 245]